MSAAIFVALALGWAVYLTPKALRRHDQAARTRSIDTFSSDMRVVAHRQAVDSRTAELVTPHTKQSRAAGPVRMNRRAARVAARRRRRILYLLLLAGVVVGVLSVRAILQPWAVAIPLGLTVLFLVLSRVMVRHERSASRRRRVNRYIEHRREVIATADAGDLEEPEEALAIDVRLRNAQGFEQVTDTEDTAAIDVSALDVTDVDAASLWDPLPVTLPTYVSKEKAPRTVRAIDLDDPSVANSGRDAADSALVAEAATATAPDDETGSAAQHAV